MALGFPILKLPTAPETLAFRAVETLLTTDPILKATVRAWRSWQGAPEDILDPTVATCPYVRLSPRAGASVKETENSHRVMLLCGIQVAVAGSNRDNLFNFWGAVRDALYPSDPTAHARRENLATNSQISKAIMTLNGYGISGARDVGLRMLIAQGTIELTMLVTTP